MFYNCQVKGNISFYLFFIQALKQLKKLNLTGLNILKNQRRKVQKTHKMQTKILGHVETVH